jgi:hypothetical protein
VLLAVVGVLILDAYIDSAALTSIATAVKSWGAIIAAFALGVGSISLVSNHVKIISRKRETALESTILLAGLLFMVIVGVTSSTSAPAYQFVFDYVLSPGGSTIFSLLAFYIASAAYRAFRVRSTEATVMLISAVLVMLGRVPIGKLMWSQFPAIAQWFIDVPNIAGMRGITICAALGTVATSVRVLLGIERGSVGGGQ